MLCLLLFGGISFAKLICPDPNPLNCYPELFEPSTDWKTVKEGQIIPGGLDIRLNIDTLEREAKLSDNNKPHENGAVIVSEDIMEFDEEQDFSEALRHVSKFVDHGVGDPATLLRKLEFISEMSSDSDYGVDTMQYIQPLIRLSGLYDEEGPKDLNDDDRDEIRERATIILASSLRNNAEAQRKFLQYFSDPMDFVDHLTAKIENDVLLRRRLGILGSLLNSGWFMDRFESIKKKLLILYPQLENQATKQRLMHIISDITGDVADEDNDRQFANIAQLTLIGEKALDDGTLTLLDELKKLKLNNRKLFKARSEFLEWLNLQMEALKAAKDPKLEEFRFLRHEVFGNPKAMRKSYDEL
ncbi:hypothetical protein KL910_005192 [Ogataea haglerorum]|nr:hypothetical protein KL945_005033 [Ogataea haglerorum]KAG7784264.1 hypothetical protein KL910_005192 [Ogataea haglerorum]KAG7795805.1 hypothetical protein KL944_005296 [Ogataea haglerorum]